MKKTYNQPKMVITVVELQQLLAGSIKTDGTPQPLSSTPAEGAALSRGVNVWGDLDDEE